MNLPHTKIKRVFSHLVWEQLYALCPSWLSENRYSFYFFAQYWTDKHWTDRGFVVAPDLPDSSYLKRILSLNRVLYMNSENGVRGRAIVFGDFSQTLYIMMCYKKSINE